MPVDNGQIAFLKMIKRIFVLFLALLSCLLLFCSCEKKREKTETSITTELRMGELQVAKHVTLTLKHKESGEKIKVTVRPDEKKEIELEPGTYFISNVHGETKQIDISLNEKFFTVSKAYKNVSLSVAKEDKMDDIAWLIYNNAIYLVALVGCCVFLGVNKFIKEKKMNMH